MSTYSDNPEIPNIINGNKIVLYGRAPLFNSRPSPYFKNLQCYYTFKNNNYTELTGMNKFEIEESTKSNNFMNGFLLSGGYDDGGDFNKYLLNRLKKINNINLDEFSIFMQVQFQYQQYDSNSNGYIVKLFSTSTEPAGYGYNRHPIWELHGNQQGGLWLNYLLDNNGNYHYPNWPYEVNNAYIYLIYTFSRKTNTAFVYIADVFQEKGLRILYLKRKDFAINYDWFDNYFYLTDNDYILNGNYYSLMNIRQFALYDKFLKIEQVNQILKFMQLSPDML